VGIEKRPMMLELFAADDLAVMERLRAAFDPDRRLNPCKILPGSAGCGESHAHGTAEGRVPGEPAQIGAGAEGAWI